MGNKDQVPFEDDDLDTLDAIDDDLDFDGLTEDPLESPEKDETKALKRLNARREIERRNELKALNSNLDEWDALDDVADW